MKNDRTSQAVRQQLKAMDCERYQIGIISAHTEGKAINKYDLTPEQVMAEIPNLKRLNAQGNHIYIQPAEDEHKLVLVAQLVVLMTVLSKTPPILRVPMIF